MARTQFVSTYLRGMKELPPMRIEDFRRERVKVTRFSTIRAAENTYSGQLAADR